MINDTYFLPFFPPCFKIQGWSSGLYFFATIPYFFRLASSLASLPNSLPAPNLKMKYIYLRCISTFPHVKKSADFEKSEIVPTYFCSVKCYIFDMWATYLGSSSSVPLYSLKLFSRSILICRFCVFHFTKSTDRLELNLMTWYFFLVFLKQKMAICQILNTMFTVTVELSSRSQCYNSRFTNKLWHILGNPNGVFLNRWLRCLFDCTRCGSCLKQNLCHIHDCLQKVII